MLYKATDLPDRHYFKSPVDLKLHLYSILSEAVNQPFAHVYQFCYKAEYLQASAIHVLLQYGHKTQIMPLCCEFETFPQKLFWYHLYFEGIPSESCLFFSIYTVSEYLFHGALKYVGIYTFFSFVFLINVGSAVSSEWGRLGIIRFKESSIFRSLNKQLHSSADYYNNKYSFMEHLCPKASSKAHLKC